MNTCSAKMTSGRCHRNQSDFGFGHDVRYSPADSRMQFAGGLRRAVAGSVANEIFLSQSRRQASEGTLPVDTVARRFDGSRARVACINVNPSAVKPTRLLKRYRYGERFLAGCTGCAPDVQRTMRMSTEILRNNHVHKGADLIHLAPEERFLNRQHFEKPRPFIRRPRIVLQDVVVIQERIKSPFHGQWRKLAEEQIDLGILEAYRPVRSWTRSRRSANVTGDSRIGLEARLILVLRLFSRAAARLGGKRCHDCGRGIRVLAVGPGNCDDLE